MKRILFSVGINAVEALGTVTRMIAIADEIRILNPSWIILFRAAGPEADHVAKHGYDFIPGYKPTMYGLPGWVWEIIYKIQGEWDGTVSPVKSMYSIIQLKGICTKKYVTQTYEEWDKLVQTFKPDAIVSEFDLISPIIAKKYSIPLFSTYVTVGEPSFFSELFYTKPRPNKKQPRQYNRLLQQLGMPKVTNILELFGGYEYSNRLIPSIPEMEDLQSGDRNHFVGNIIPKKFSGQMWNWKKRKPLIYVYLSIGQITPQLAEQVLIDAFSKSDFDVVFSGAGHPYFEGKGEYSIGNVHFFKYLPSDEVLKQADIAIHHGGQNTTLQCIEAKVPALIFPGEHFERYYNAKKAAQIGCAYNLANKQFEADRLLFLCKEIITNNVFIGNLDHYSQVIRKLGGRKRAAELVIQCIG